ncbi:hypothetical protein D9M73_134940 [compost metagenome]
MLDGCRLAAAPCIPLHIVEVAPVRLGERQVGDQRRFLQHPPGAIFQRQRLFPIGQVDLLGGALGRGVLAQAFFAARRPHHHRAQQGQERRPDHVARVQVARRAGAGLVLEQVDGFLLRLVERQRIDERRQPLHRIDARVVHAGQLNNLGQRALALVEALVQGHRLGIIGILGPGHPEFVDGEIGTEEALLLVAEAGEMVVVLVGQHHQVEVAAGGLVEVLDDALHQLPRTLHALQHAAVDEDVAPLLAALLAQQEAVAKDAPVHPHGDFADRTLAHGIRLPGGSWRRDCRQPARHGRSSPVRCCRPAGNADAPPAAPRHRCACGSHSATRRRASR